MASSHSSVSLAGAHADGERAAAAERGHAAIRNENREVIDVLSASAVSPSFCQDAGCIIYNSETRMTFQGGKKRKKKKKVIYCWFPIKWKNGAS